MFEPGLAEMIAERRAAEHLAFGEIGAAETAEAEVVWITFDTPVDDEDRADVGSVLAQSELAPPQREARSSCPPRSCPSARSASCPGGWLRPDGKDLRFACVPENLRLGRAIEVFTHTDRFVAGVRDDRDRAQLEPLLSRFTERIEWMGVGSAEMTKHALNAFLATSVAFINEVSAIASASGPRRRGRRGLKSEARIGPRATSRRAMHLRRDAGAGHRLPRSARLREGLPARLVTASARATSPIASWASRTLESPVPRRTRGAADRRLGTDIQARHEHVATLLGARAL